MKTLYVLLLACIFAGCSGKSGDIAPVPSPGSATTAAPSPTAFPTAFPTPKNGDYPGSGKITKINPAGSVELDHQEVVGVMPPMLMEFNVTDKNMLKPLKVGDQVTFLLRYTDGQEILSKIEKAK